MQNEKALRWAINIAAMVVLMDLSAVNIGLPEMRLYFNLSISLISLVLMVSMLTATSSALIIGKISQIVSPKKILILGFFVFGTTTFLSGIVRDFRLLLFLRFIQGFAEAALYIIGPALIKRYISPEKQSTAYGQWMMSTGIGIAIGPLIGGYLVSVFSWPSVFFINIPPILLGLWFSFNLKINFQKKEKEKFDFLGAFLSFGFLACLIAAVFIGKHIGWMNSYTFLPLIFSSIFLIAYLYREKNCKYPIIQLDLFKIRNFWLAGFGLLLFFIVNVGSRFLRPFYFEEGRGFSSEISGLLMVVAPVVMIIFSPFTNYFQRLCGTKTVVLIGNFFLLVSMIMFSFWNSSSSLMYLIVSMLILGVAMGLFYPATTTIGMLALPQDSYGMGSSVIASAKSMGKLFGVLIFALLFNFFMYDFIQFTETTLSNKKIEAMQYVFQFAAGLSLVGLIFSFFFQIEKRK